MTGSRLLRHPITLSRLLPVGFVFLAAIGWLVAGCGGSQSATEEAVASIREQVIEAPDAMAVVATVNGMEIHKREVLTPVLVGQELPGAVGPATVEEALESSIEQRLLLHGAREAGVTVSDEEAQGLVDGALHAYREGLLSEDEVALFSVFLEASGTTLEGAATSEEYRQSLADNLAVGRYLASQDAERDVLVAELRERAVIETFPERLR